MQRKYLAFLFFLAVSISGFSSLKAQHFDVRIEPETSGRLFEECSMELIIEMQDVSTIRSRMFSVTIECSGAAEYANLPASVELTDGKAIVPFTVAKMPEALDGKDGTITVFSEYYPEVKKELTYAFYNSPTYKLTYSPQTEMAEGKLDLEIKGGSLYMLRQWGNNGEPIDARMPFTAWEIENASEGDVLRLWEPNSCWSSTITLVSNGESNPGGEPPITRLVTIPVLKEAKTDPGAGLYRITSGTNFPFRIIPNTGYENHILTVTTDRELPDEEGVKVEKNEDGTYSVTILRIQTATNIGIAFQSPVENELITTQKIWGGDGLHISLEEGGRAKVYSITGQLIKTISFSRGETIHTVLPKGLYLILMDNRKVHKVIIR